MSSEKQQNYAHLKERLKIALRYSFWFEACMIEYAIVEDRTSSILYHANVCKNAYDSSKKLSNKLNSIELQIGKGHPIISKKVTPGLVHELTEWKNDRNDLVHRACVLYNEDKAREIAENGKVLVDRLSNDAQKVTRAANKAENTSK